MKIFGHKNGGHCLHAKPFPWSKQEAHCCRCPFKTNQSYARGLVPLDVPMDAPICPKEPRGEWSRDFAALWEWDERGISIFTGMKKRCANSV